MDESWKHYVGTSLVVQWLRLQAPNAGDPGSIPDQETRSHILQLRPSAVKYKKKGKEIKHCVEWNKPYTEGQIGYDSISMKFLEQANS